MTCYADDTMVLATGADVATALRGAEAGVRVVIRRIEDLGLRVCVSKTEAVLFHRPRRRPKEMPTLTLGGTQIPVMTSLKYLGLVLDGPWIFVEHFRQRASCLERGSTQPPDA